MSDSEDMYVRPIHKMKYMQSICFDIPLLLCVKGKKKSYLRHTHFHRHTYSHLVLLSPPLPTLPLQNNGDTHPSDKDDHSNKKSRHQRKEGKKHGDKRHGKECEHRKKSRGSGIQSYMKGIRQAWRAECGVTAERDGPA